MTSRGTFRLSESSQPIGWAIFKRENQSMDVFSWLFQRTPTEQDAPPPIVTRDGNKAPVIGRDGTEDETTIPAPALRYTLEPYFWMIEYQDSHGDITQRRVTMRTVEERGAHQYLYAFCHERQALRMFRLDRISCLISPDGEVENATAWFSSTLAGCEVIEYTPRPRPRGTREGTAPAANPLTSYTTLKRHIAPGMILLTAAARSDNYLHPRELDRIIRFAEDCAFTLRDSGKLPGDVQGEDFDKLERTIKRLRPLTSDIEAAFAEIATWPKDRTKHLFAALTATARADGIVDDIEADFLASLRDFGTKYHGIGWEE